MTTAVAGAATRTGHLPGLDGLRGIAVLLVLLAHFGEPLGVGAAGYVGVTLFFTLSGFLITRIFTGDLRGFYIRRLRRLLPALLAVSAVVALAGAVNGGQLAAVGLYVGNWYRASGGDLGPLNHTWSLAIEEQFYLVWPLVLLAVPRQARRIAVAGALAVVAWRTLHWADPATQFSTFTRADAILAGCWLALSHRRLSSPWALAGLAALCLVPSMTFANTVGLTACTVLGVFAVGWAATSDRLAHPVLVWFGQRAYGLYLWHFVIWVMLDLPVLVEVGLTLAAAEVSWRVIEAPWLRRQQTVRMSDRTMALVCSPSSNA